MSEQPKPIPNSHDASWLLVSRDLMARGEYEVLGDITERNAMGVQKYGMPLQPFNGRDSLRDAFEESMDLVVYLKNAIQELPPVLPFSQPYRTLNRIYHTALGLMCALKDYQDYMAAIKAEREELESQAVIHPHQTGPGLMDALAMGHQRLREAQAKKWGWETLITEEDLEPIRDSLAPVVTLYGNVANHEESTVESIPTVWLADPSQTYQAHTGHPGASQGHSSVEVANVEPVVFIPPGLPQEIQAEIEAWKKNMDASLAASREQHSRFREEVEKAREEQSRPMVTRSQKGEHFE